MSISWYLYCIDDAEGLWLGKLIDSDPTRENTALRFYIGDVADDVLAQSIQKFMLLHRTHELRTVTEKFFVLIEDDDHPIQLVEIPDLLSMPLEPDPIDQEQQPVLQSAYDRAREALVGKARMR